MMSAAPKETHGLRCPQCGCPETRVIQTRRRGIVVNGEQIGGVRRDRECENCKWRFWTSEQVDDD